MSSGFTVGIVDTSDRGGEREKRGLYALVVPEYLGYARGDCGNRGDRYVGSTVTAGRAFLWLNILVSLNPYISTILLLKS